MENQYIEIGKIVTTQALKGEVKVMPWCDYPEFIIEFESLYLGKDKKILEIESSKIMKNMVVLKFKNFDTIEQAQKIVNQILYINKDDVELDEGTYFVQDLIGLKVYDIDSKILYGELIDVHQTGANDVYTIKGETREYLVPAIPDVVLETNIEEKTMFIRPLKGLFEDDED
jgi:16S rRNA processing protein RimM